MRSTDIRFSTRIASRTRRSIIRMDRARDMRGVLTPNDDVSHNEDILPTNASIRDIRGDSKFRNLRWHRSNERVMHVFARVAICGWL